LICLLSPSNQKYKSGRSLSSNRVVPPRFVLVTGASKVSGLDEEKTCKPGRAFDELQRGRKLLGWQFFGGKGGGLEGGTLKNIWTKIGELTMTPGE